MSISKTQNFFEQINQAFLEGDIAFIADNVTEDVVWTMVGEGVIRGKDAFVEYMEKMGSDNTGEGTLTIDSIISDGQQAAVTGKMSGEMGAGEVKNYMYCDVYRFDGETGKIKELTAFIIETKD